MNDCSLAETFEKIANLKSFDFPFFFFFFFVAIV